MPLRFTTRRWGIIVLQHLRQTGEVFVTVVEVVDDADVRDSVLLSRSMMAIWFSGSPNQPPWL